MSLDKILKKIEEEASKKAREILDQAESKTSEVEEEGVKWLEGLEEQARKEEAAVDTELRNAILLPARLEVRGLKLAAKNELVDRVFSEAMKFEKQDYKKVLDHLFSQISKVEGGELHPAKGREDITNEFVKEKKIKVKVGDSVPGIMGGFLLKSGKIEYDCSFDTLLRKLKEKLEPQVAQLFVKGE